MCKKAHFLGKRKEEGGEEENVQRPAPCLPSLFLCRVQGVVVEMCFTTKTSAFPVMLALR